MDKCDYREKTAGKIVTYAANGLVLWDNFIITFDDDKGGIDVGQIERIFNAFVI